MAGKGETQFVVVDGLPGAEYNGIRSGSLTFSADARHLAYAAKSAEKWLVVVDGQPVQSTTESVSGLRPSAPTALWNTSQ